MSTYNLVNVLNNYNLYSENYLFGVQKHIFCMKTVIIQALN